MASQLDLYRQIDAQYRILHRLYSLEHLQHEQLKAQYESMRNQTLTTSGAAAGAVLVVVPLLVSVFQIEWGSAPAIIIYGLGAVVFVTMIWRICDARESYEEALENVEKYSREPLEDWLDYHKGIIAMAVERCGVLSKVLQETDDALDEAIPGPEKDQLEERRRRVKLTDKYFRDLTWETVRKSEKLVETGERTEKKHDEVLLWADPIIGDSSPPSSPDA